MACLVAMREARALVTMGAPPPNPASGLIMRSPRTSRETLREASLVSRMKGSR
jgi:hypothetical protein